VTVRPLFAKAAQALATTNRPAGGAARPGTYRIDNADTDTATVYIYDEIGGAGIWAAALVPQLAALKASRIDVRLNSPGGDYFDGVAIGNALAEHPAQVTVHVDGLAASAASVLAMAADRIVMHPGARMMIHDALTMTYGNAADHSSAGQLLDAVSQDIAGIYALRAGGIADEWRGQMKAETWFSDQEAVSARLADELHAPTPTPQLEEDPTQPRWAALLNDWRAHLTPIAAPVEATPDVAPQASVTLSELVRSALTGKEHP
jgi:ATP-dependent protease ClpP protease subunit